jgi:hypothetical protein
MTSTKWKLHRNIYAEIAKFIGEGENGDIFRELAGPIQIPHERDGCTYLNGLLHSV